MPLYEYQCDGCGHRFEVIQKFSDPLVSICPKCAGVVHKLASSPAFQFKGSGWYITDYAKKESPGAGKAGEGGEKPSGKDADAGGSAKSSGDSGSGEKSGGDKKVGNDKKAGGAESGSSAPASTSTSSSAAASDAASKAKPSKD